MHKCNLNQTQVYRLNHPHKMSKMCTLPQGVILAAENKCQICCHFHLNVICYMVSLYSFGLIHLTAFPNKHQVIWYLTGYLGLLKSIKLNPEISSASISSLNWIKLHWVKGSNLISGEKMKTAVWWVYCNPQSVDAVKVLNKRWAWLLLQCSCIDWMTVKIAINITRLLSEMNEPILCWIIWWFPSKHSTIQTSCHIQLCWCKPWWKHRQLLNL